MKKYILQILLVVTATIILFSCTDTRSTEYEIGEDITYLKIGTNITKGELREICDDMKSQKDIEIDFSKSKFDAKGKITDLDIKVNTIDGNGGHYSSTPYRSRAGFLLNENSFYIGDSNSFPRF